MSPGLPELVDTHAHLDDPRLRDDLAAVLDRARAVGVVQVLAIGTTAESSAEAVRLAETHPMVFAAVGIQPNHVVEEVPGDWERIVALAGHPRVVAIGETGLDRYWDRTPFERQQARFADHLELARERGLPVVIHCRDCEQDILDQLRALNRSVAGVLHSFTGNREHAQGFLDVGLYISFAGQITFRNKNLDPFREVAAELPTDRLLVETDSPYLSPHPHRGKDNEPARVVHTAEQLGRLHGMGLDRFAPILTANARRLFVLPSPT